jgi:hypothetical protein
MDFMANFRVGPYDPCPCGSGEKYKFCCMKKTGAERYPAGTLALYGPNDKITTKIVAGYLAKEDAEPIIERFVGAHIKDDPKVVEKIKAFFAEHKVSQIVISDGNMGCPHEQPDDFPIGEDCPFCPWWAGKQGLTDRG